MQTLLAANANLTSSQRQKNLFMKLVFLRVFRQGLLTKPSYTLRKKPNVTANDATASLSFHLI